MTLTSLGFARRPAAAECCCPNAGSGLSPRVKMRLAPQSKADQAATMHLGQATPTSIWPELVAAAKAAAELARPPNHPRVAVVVVVVVVVVNEGPSM